MTASNITLMKQAIAHHIVELLENVMNHVNLLSHSKQTQMKQTTDKSQVDIIPDEVIEKEADGYIDKHLAGLWRNDSDWYAIHAAIVKIIQAERSKTHDEKEQRIKELEEVMQEFVDRVERGEVRSKKTYAKFKRV